MSSDNKQLERVICSKHGVMYGYCSECIATGDHGDVQHYPESAQPAPVAQPEAQAPCPDCAKSPYGTCFNPNAVAPRAAPVAEALQRAEYILDHYSRSHADKLCLARALEQHDEAKDAQIAALQEQLRIRPSIAEQTAMIDNWNLANTEKEAIIEELRGSVTRAEADNQKLREALQGIFAARNGFNELTLARALDRGRALLSPTADTPVSELPNVAVAGLTHNGKRLLIPIRITDLHGQGLGCVLPRGEAIEIEQSLVPVGKHYILAHELFEVVCQRLLDAKAITEKPTHDFIDQCSGMLFMTIAMSGLWNGVTPDQAQQFFEYLEKQPNGKIVAAAEGHMGIDPAAPNSDRSVEVTYKAGEIVSERVIEGEKGAQK